MKNIFLLLTILLFPASVQAGPTGAGKELFRKHCAACHGSDGDGGVGVPLSLPSFVNHVGDEYLVKTIRHGRPGRVMPAFKNLSDHDVQQLLKFLRTWTGNKGMNFSAKPVKGSRAKGKTLFNQKCAACHGVVGQAGAATANNNHIKRFCVFHKQSVQACFSKPWVRSVSFDQGDSI